MSAEVRGLKSLSELKRIERKVDKKYSTETKTKLGFKDLSTQCYLSSSAGEAVCS